MMKKILVNYNLQAMANVEVEDNDVLDMDDKGIRKSIVILRDSMSVTYDMLVNFDYSKI